MRVRLRAELSAGDGVAFGAAATEAGGALWAVHAHSGDEVTLELEDPRKLVGVRPGQLVWRTQHAALQRQLKTALADASAGRALVDVALSGDVGEPLTVKVTDGRGRSASTQTEAVIEAATGEGLGEAAVAKAVGQLGGSPLLLRHLDVDGALAAGGGAWLPLSAVKEARRVAVDRLVEQRAAQRVLARKLSPALKAARAREEAPARGGGGAAPAGENDDGAGLRTRPPVGALPRGAGGGGRRVRVRR